MEETPNARSVVPDEACTGPLLEFRSIDKSFFGVEVLRGVSFAVQESRVVGLVGENGAGKSTLMNILGGNLRSDGGEMLWNGERYRPGSPREAERVGVAFIHQELNLFPNLTIAENLFIGGFPRRWGWIDPPTMRKRARGVLREVRLEHGPDTPVEALSAGERQLVEIAKALLSDARLIILDEPTTSLTARETERLFEIIGRLRDRGLALIYISHNLEHVRALGDDLVILRAGRVVGQGAITGYTLDRVVSLMVGREITQFYPGRASQPGADVVLEVRGVSQPGMVRGINFQLRRSEVLGVSGLMELRTRLARWRGATSVQPTDPGVPPGIKRILVLREGESATTRETLELAREFLGELGTPFGAGSDCNFCELNREQAMGRLGIEAADFLFWSVNPQVHAVDSWSVMETIEAQGATVRTARAFAGDRPVAVSPLTLKQRFNPVATGPEPELEPDALPPQVDPRQMSLFAAAWTVGSLSALAESGAASLTYYETVGWRGIMAREQGGQNRAGLPAEPGMLFPVYSVFAAVRGYEQWQAISSAVPRRAIGLGLRGDGGRRRLLLANLTEHPVEAWVQGLEGVWQARELEVGNARRAFHDPGSFWEVPGEPLLERGAGRHLRIGRLRSGGGGSDLGSR